MIGKSEIQIVVNDEATDFLVSIVERMEAAAARIESAMAPQTIEFERVELDDESIARLREALADHERKRGRARD